MHYLPNYAIALLGVLLAYLFQFPIPWMLGPLFLLLIASQLVPLKILPTSSTKYFLMLIGIYIGSKFDVQDFSRDFGILVLLLLIVAFVGFFFSFLFLKKVGMSKVEAMGSAMPGAFAFLLLYITKHNIPIKRILVIHLIRILVILFAAPIFFDGVLEKEIFTIQDELNVTSFYQWSVLLIFSGGIAFLADKFILIQSSGFLTASFCSALLYLLGVVEVQPPSWGLNFLLFMIATTIASRLADFQVIKILKDIGLGIVVTFIMLMICVAIVAGCYFFLDFSFLTYLLALIPGGIHEISLIALVYNLDPVLITFIHWVRVVIIAVAMPYAMQWAQKRKVLK